MKTTKFYNRFLRFTALAALLTGNAFADVVIFDNMNSRRDYFAAVSPTVWEFTGSHYETGPRDQFFGVQEKGGTGSADAHMYSRPDGGEFSVDGNKISYTWGKSSSSYIKGTGWGVDLSNMQIDSFYLDMYSSWLWNMTTYDTYLTLEATDSFGNEYFAHSREVGFEIFFGLILDEGYFTDVKWYWSNGTEDTPLLFDEDGSFATHERGLALSFEFGFGDGTASPVVPEPATMLIAGLGIAVVAATRRIRCKGQKSKERKQ